MDWNLFWFVLLGVLLTGYAILDGFDLGVGMLHFVGRNDQERRIILNSIGPIWDGNEVWLVTFGGALFAAFPEAYATIFSGYYAAFMAVLGALIFRAVSIEFRSKLAAPAWRKTWDIMFSLSSLLASLVFGVAVGSAMQGIPLTSRGIFEGSLREQIDWYPLLVGALTIAMFVVHGAIYLSLKTTGELQTRVRRWTWRGYFAFLLLYIVTTIATLMTIPRSTMNFQQAPWAMAIVVLNLLAVANIPRSLYRNKLGVAFLSSAATIAGLICLFGVALFPNLVTSNPTEINSLTIYNASSSQYTLRLMSVIALIGMPFVATYTVVVYWTFRGDVKIDKHSY